MSTQPAGQSAKLNKREPFDLEDYVRRSAEASTVPFHIDDITVLSDVAAMVKLTRVRQHSPAVDPAPAVQTRAAR